ncbi:MAG: T9SS type A sorting domain-containing protein [Bacteroidetes bacterium]|nr:T9SS type A sorting domain-containing protein [Bacteroidota bacterium]
MNLKLILFWKQKTEVEISMVNTKGEIFRETVIAEDGYNSYKFNDNKGLTSGYYFVSVSYKGQKVTKKILKY